MYCPLTGHMGVLVVRAKILSQKSDETLPLLTGWCNKKTAIKMILKSLVIGFNNGRYYPNISVLVFLN